MAEKQLESSALSAFCGSMATMMAAGIQSEEAALMLSENRERSRFQEVCRFVYERLIEGQSLSQAMKGSGGFPDYTVNMVATGEQSGHLEPALRNLEVYYSEEDRVFNKLRSSVGYPAALLCIMTGILAFTVIVILPVFSGVYRNIAGSMQSGLFASTAVSNAIGIVALIVTAICAILALVLSLSTRSETGRTRAIRMFEKIGPTRKAMYQLALSRFTAALATFVSSGITSEDAMHRAIETVEHEELKAKLQGVYKSMVDLDNPRSLTQAISEHQVFDPLYVRMLNVGSQAGSVDQILSQLSETFFDDAIVQIDAELDRIEPLMAAFLTIAVGATLVAVMLPLVGIMTALG